MKGIGKFSIFITTKSNLEKILDPPLDPTLMKYLFPLLGIAVYYVLGGLLLYAFRHSERVAKRQLMTLYFKTVLSFFVNILSLCMVVIWYDPSNITIPCWSRIPVIYLCIPLWTLSFFFRASHLYAIYVFQQNKILELPNLTIRNDIVASSKLENSPVSTSSPSTVVNLESAEKKSSLLEKSRLSMFLKIDEAANSILKFVIKIIVKSEVIFNTITQCILKTPEKDKEVSIPWKEKGGSLLSKKSIPIMFFWMLVLSIFEVALVYIIGVFFSSTPASEVGCYASDYVILYIFCALFMILCPAFLIGIRNLKDNLQIRSELIGSMLIYWIASILYVYFAMFNRIVCPNIFITIGGLIINFLTCYFPPIMEMIEKCHSMEPDTNLEYLEMVLRSPKLLHRLKEIAARNLNIENIQFLEDLQKGKKDPYVIYKEYLIPDSSSELNLPSEIKSPLDSAYRKQEITLATFQEADKYIRVLVLFNTLNILVAEEGRKKKLNL